MTATRTTAPPGPYFEKGKPLAESAGDGETCGSTETFTGEPCELPARYGRNGDGDPDDPRCHRHAVDVERCGHPTLHGGPCLVPAGHGTDSEGGVCHFHAEAAREDKRQVQAEFLAHLARELTVTKAAEATGIGVTTAYLWAKQYEDFGTAVERLLNGHVSNRRLSRIEETLFERAADDRASSAERIFALCNLSAPGDGWQDVKLLRHEHSVEGGVLVTPAAPDGDSWDEAARDQQEELIEDRMGREIEAQATEVPAED